MNQGLAIEEQVELQAYNAMALSCQAEFFCAIHSIDNLQEAVLFAQQRRLPISVIGGGSNIILPPKIAGLVMHMQIPGIHQEPLQKGDYDTHLVTVGAGENWHHLVNHCLASGSYGLENLSLIPGNCGAAPIQNIGAYGVELEEVFHSLKAYDIRQGELITLSKSDCQFSYRDSIFKNAWRNKVIITEMSLRLSATPELRIDYPALRQALANRNPAEVTPQVVAQTVCEIRSSKLPDPKVAPNVGSFFKNPIIEKSQAEAIRKQFPKLVSYPLVEQGKEKLAAAWLIDQLGWKGKQRGSVGVHDQQALVLVNHGNARSDELLTLAGEIADSVQQQFGVTLELEPQLPGW